MSLLYFKNYCALGINTIFYIKKFIIYLIKYYILGFNEFNPKEKEINCLT